MPRRAQKKPRFVEPWDAFGDTPPPALAFYPTRPCPEPQFPLPERGNKWVRVVSAPGATPRGSAPTPRGHPQSAGPTPARPGSAPGAPGLKARRRLPSASRAPAAQLRPPGRGGWPRASAGRARGAGQSWGGDPGVPSARSSCATRERFWGGAGGREKGRHRLGLPAWVGTPCPSDPPVSRFLLCAPRQPSIFSRLETTRILPGAPIWRGGPGRLRGAWLGWRRPEKPRHVTPLSSQ